MKTESECLVCGNRGFGKKFCSRGCYYKSLSGEKSRWWKGGTYVTKKGYLIINDFNIFRKASADWLQLQRVS
jgi:hypothetical protein